MKKVNGNDTKELLHYEQNSLGTFLYYPNIFTVEMNEGIHVNYEKSKRIFDKAISFYDADQPLGYISNRINNYSIEALDYPKLFGMMPMVKIFGVVYYNNFSKFSVGLERRFSNVPYYSFDNFGKAYDFTKKYLSELNDKTA